MLLPKETQIAAIIQADIPLRKTPFRTIAQTVGATEEEVLSVIKDLKQRGVIRKFGAIVRHQKAGYTKNALVVWAAHADEIQRAGEIIASFPEVTHCYERTPAWKGRYNLFSMVHLKAGSYEQIATMLSRASGIADFQILESREEFKKSSMEYF
ncbi:MAG: Lrp/AsnC family transcriptional regulator [Smithellaceae bacterium]|nr:Lrp/AsnC family transcriptional regulator [Smithellaceae bacterium]